MAGIAVGHPWSVRRTGLLITGWGLATLFAIILGLQAVSAISGSVTNSTRAPLSPGSVKAALDRSSSSISSSSSSSSTDSSGEAVSSDVSSGSTANDDHSNQPTSSSVEPAFSSDEASESNGSSDVAAPEDRTYQLVGGSVGVRFENGEAHLLWAAPNPGYRSESHGGSSSVDMRFESDGHESRLKAFWDNGPQQEIEEKD